MNLGRPSAWLPPTALMAVLALNTSQVSLRARPHSATIAIQTLSQTLGVFRCAARRPSGECIQAAVCPPGQVSLNTVCVALRSVAPDDVTGSLVSNSHTDRGGNLVVYEHIPRRPDLPIAYDRYEYPTLPWGGHTVTSGYDLGRVDSSQRRGPDFSAVGHGGVDLPQDRGAPVRVISLRGQQGEAEVVYAGHLFGTR